MELDNDKTRKAEATVDRDRYVQDTLKKLTKACDTFDLEALNDAMGKAIELGIEGPEVERAKTMRTKLDDEKEMSASLNAEIKVRPCCLLVSPCCAVCASTVCRRPAALCVHRPFVVAAARVVVSAGARHAHEVQESVADRGAGAARGRHRRGQGQRPEGRLAGAAGGPEPQGAA